MEKDLDPYESKSASTCPDQEKSLFFNIERYKKELDEVSLALESASEENKQQLQELQFNLISILELTLNQLDQCQKDVKSAVNLKSQDINQQESESDSENEKFNKFPLEISGVKNVSDKAEEYEEELSDKAEEYEEEFSDKVKYLESSIKLLEGQNIRAPYIEPWGGFSYHNAVILSFVSSESNLINYDNPEVLVLFSQPTCIAMIPCNFFLKGCCQFSEDRCKYSHGYRVAVNDLKEYRELDRDDVVSGSRVLVLHNGKDIWHIGVVEDVLENQRGFSFNCLQCAQLLEIDQSPFVPCFAEEEDTKIPSSLCQSNKLLSSHSSSCPAADEADFAPSAAWIHTSLTKKLGEWEKHTKGIGSKLMAKMGYINGRGLGPTGEGRVDPVKAYVYPQGVSLDHCIRMREKNNKGRIADGQKQGLNDQKKPKEKKKAQDSSNLQSVFDIINCKLNIDKPLAEAGKEKVAIGNRQVLKKVSSKDLGLKNLALSTRIDKLKNEVINLKNSRERHATDTKTLKLIDCKVAEKLKEISSLENAEQQVHFEQQNRKDMQKLFTF